MTASHADARPYALVVDDDGILRMDIAEILEQVGFRTLEAGDGEMPEGARFIGKPFSAETVHGHLREILPDDRKPEPLRG